MEVTKKRYDYSKKEGVRVENDLKEKILKGLTGIDYIEQEQRLMKLYNENFHKHK